MIRRFWLAAVVLPSVLHGQTAAISLLGAAANTGAGNSPSRGLRGVTRPTLMVLPGQEARALFTAGGLNLGASPAAGSSAPVPPAVVAEVRPKELDRPEVKAALRRLAAAGDPDARRLLGLPSQAVVTAAWTRK